MLRKSIYNIEIDKLDNGDVLLFNSNTSAFGVMDVETQELYYTDIIDEYKINNENINENIHIMQTNGFLVDVKTDEYKQMNALSRIMRYSKTGFKLAIAPTMNCNMNCPYCYEEKNSKRMNEEIKNALINFVEKNIIETKMESFHVTWYGGEPLLEKNIILELSKKFIKITEKNGVQYSASIITNGSLLDFETAKMLKNDCKVGLAQITIDGLDNVHNNRRILKNGMNSFGMIINNIEKCKGILNVSIRVNIDKSNIANTEDLINYFINEKKWIDNEITYYFAPVTDTCNSDINSCFSSREFGEIDSQLLRLIYEKGNISSINMIYPRSRLSACGALQFNNYVVDPDGLLYKCWETIGLKEYSVGNIFSGPVLNDELANWLTLDVPQNCIKCNTLPICQAGCPYERIKSNSEQKCSHVVYSFKEKLKITYDHFSKSN